MVKNFAAAKLLIIDHYDTLTREIDLYTESLLEKSVDSVIDDNVIKEEICTSSNKKNNMIETYGIYSRFDPYDDQYIYNDEDFVPDLTGKICDYLNTTRTNILDTLKEIQEENFKHIFELNKTNRFPIDCSIDKSELMCLVFEKKFCFNIELVHRTLHSKIKSASSLYTVIIDFYLSSKDIELLR